MAIYQSKGQESSIHLMNKTGCLSSLNLILGFQEILGEKLDSVVEVDYNTNDGMSQQQDR